MKQRILSRRFRYSNKPNWSPSQYQQDHIEMVRHKIDNCDYRRETHRCSVCDASSFLVVAEKERNGLPCSTSVCVKCGLLFTNPRFREQDYADFYENHFRPIMKDSRRPRGMYEARSPVQDYTQSPDQGVGRSMTDEDFFWEVNESPRVQDAYQFIQTHINMDSPRKILDIGCGSGALLYKYLSDGHCCVGVDYDEQHLVAGRSHGLTLFAGDSKVVNEKEFDMVVLSHSLEHMVMPEQTIEKINKILKPDGYIFIEVPNVLDWIKPPYRDLMHFIQFVHIYNFTPQSLSNLMMKFGFERIAISHNSIGRNILAMFGKENHNTRHLITEYPTIYRKLLRHERRRWLNKNYMVSKTKFYSYPLREMLGLSHRA